MIDILLQLKTLCEQVVILMTALLSLYMPFGGIGDTLPTQETQLLQTIESAQSSYYVTHNRYFQGLPTHKTAPAEITTPNNLSVKPGYQTEGWNNFIILPPMRKGIIITQYETPKKEHGYQVIFYWQDKGILYKQSFGYGPESIGRTFETNCVLGSKFCGI